MVLHLLLTWCNVAVAVAECTHYGRRSNQMASQGKFHLWSRLPTSKIQCILSPQENRCSSPITKLSHSFLQTIPGCFFHRNFCYPQKSKLIILHTAKILCTLWRFPWWFKREVTVFLYFCLSVQLPELTFLKLHTLVFIYLSMLSHVKPGGGCLCLFAIWYLNFCSLKSLGR